MSMKTYSFHGFIAREATLRVAAARFPMARFEKLRFGLAFMPMTEELSAALAGAAGPRQLSNEVDRLHTAAADFAADASRRGPVAYVEGEVEGGSGWHAGVAWTHGMMSFRPLRLEGREPVNKALDDLGITKDPGSDNLTTLKLDDRGSG